VKRVLLVSATAKRGGAERSLASLARRLPDFGWEPVTALLERGPLEEWLDGIEVHRVAKDSRAVGAIAELALGCDAILTNKWRGQLYGGPAAARTGLPCLWWQQDFPDTTPAQLLDGSIPADVVVCSSEAVLEEQRQAAPWSHPIKIHLGVAVDEVTARRGSGARVREALGAASAPLVGIAGRLAAAKRQDLFLHAAARVAAARPDVCFVVVGGEILGTEGDYAARLEALARDLGIGERVIFAGHQEDAYAWIDALDVLAHAAEREPFGLVLVEALALGKAVVAVDTAGPSEIVEDERSGLLVPPGDLDALAEAILRALANPSGARGARARAQAFTDVRMAGAFSGALDALVSLRPSSRPASVRK
jgi:glycosyltransferase involved in cell wall biosynthesis